MADCTENHYMMLLNNLWTISPCASVWMKSKANLMNTCFQLSFYAQQETEPMLLLFLVPSFLEELKETCKTCRKRLLLGLQQIVKISIGVLKDKESDNHLQSMVGCLRRILKKLNKSMERKETDWMKIKLRSGSLNS